MGNYRGDVEIKLRGKSERKSTGKESNFLFFWLGVYQKRLFLLDIFFKRDAPNPQQVPICDFRGRGWGKFIYGPNIILKHFLSNFACFIHHYEWRQFRWSDINPLIHKGRCKSFEMITSNLAVEKKQIRIKFTSE